MLRIGLTGGIGSGKSTIAGIFEVLGIPVSYADEEARSLMNEDEELKGQIIFHFGADAYAHGLLDRSWLAGQVFADPQKLELLNSLVHPATIRAGESWMLQQQAAGAPYAVREAALIFESRGSRGLDYVIGVAAPPDLRIERTIQRDKITRSAVIGRMKYQIAEDIKMKLCDFVIRNDGQEPVLPQVLDLHERLLLLARDADGAQSSQADRH
jgi:dephospho-CoA kinase